MTRNIAGLLLGLFTGMALFVAATAAVIYLFFRLLSESPNPATDHVFGELMFWTSPLFLLGLVVSALMALVGWPVVGFWIGGRANRQSQPAHRRYSLLPGVGLAGWQRGKEARLETAVAPVVPALFWGTAVCLSASLAALFVGGLLRDNASLSGIVMLLGLLASLALGIFLAWRSYRRNSA